MLLELNLRNISMGTLGTVIQAIIVARRYPIMEEFVVFEIKKKTKTANLKMFFKRAFVFPFALPTSLSYKDGWAKNGH